MPKRVLLLLLSMTLLVFLAACAGGGEDEAGRRDRSAVGDIGAGPEVSDFVESSLAGGMWTDVQSGISIEFGAQGLLHYIQGGQDLAEYWLAYRIQDGKISVDIGGQEEIWPYSLDADTLTITWTSGYSSVFTRSGGNAESGAADDSWNDTQGNAQDHTRGNTPGNINNLGMFASDGDYLYYSDMSNNGYLSRHRLDGGERKVLMNKEVRYINLAGNSLVFTVLGNGNCPYRLDLDTGDCIKLADGVAYRITVINDIVYFISDAEFLYRMNLDGSDFGQLGMDGVRYFCVMGERIYYHNPQDNRVYRMNLDGSGAGKVSDEPLHPLSYLTVTDDSIYFLDGNSLISRMGLDGMDKKVLCRNSIRCFNLSGGTIYFSSMHDGKVRSVSTDGGEGVMLDNGKSVDGYVNEISVINGTVYYWATK